MKRSESFVIENPYTVEPESTVGHARDLLDDHHITGLPVVDADCRLVGLALEPRYPVRA